MLLKNSKVSQFLKNPGKSYLSITSDELTKFFSNGYANIIKNRCKNQYTTSDLQRCI